MHTVDLQNIVDRSVFLHERLHWPMSATAEMKIDDADTQQRALQWSRQAPRGNHTFFEKRLAWDGLNHESARLVLAPSVWRTQEPLPSWAGYLDGTLGKAAASHGGSLSAFEQETAFLDKGSPIPFEHALACFVEEASERLFKKVGVASHRISEAAAIDLQRHLLSTLSWIGEKTLLVEFIAWKAIPGQELPTDSERKAYSSFIQHLWNGGLSGLFEVYPVLARFLARAAEQWVSFVADFLRDLHEDAGLLSETFHAGQPLGQILRIKTGMSDPHNGGRTVLEVQFGRELSLFYKPRSCKPEFEYNCLLRWLNENCELPLKLRTYTVLERSSHAWTEKIYVRPCANGEPARRYFERAGMMAAVLYALEAVDCTMDNIIADGEDPVLIDTEALLQPRPRGDESDPWKALSGASKALFYDSILRLYILPRWIPRPDGGKSDLSGLGLGPENRGGGKRKVWKHINTDEMSLAWEKGQSGVDEVAQQSESVNASDYVSEIIAGFEAMYQQLAGKCQQLWSNDGPLLAMKSFATRIVVRNTYIYYGLLERCLTPQYLKNGMDASICVDVLTHLFADSEDKPRAWPMIAEEQAALLDINIPRFVSPVETDALRIGDCCIPNYFNEPGLSLFEKRFRQLSESDLDLQKRYIRCSFGAMVETQGSAANPSATSGVGETTDTDAFLAKALSIAETIHSHAICAADGTASWITQAYDPDCQFWQVQPVGLFLYDGICGIALFLAALERITGERRHRELIDGALNVVQRISSRAMQYHLERRSVGAGLGTASVAYSLAHIGLLLEDEALLETSTKLTKLITRDHVFADRRLDLLGGTAGCLLVLHSLYRLNPKPWILDLSVDCGEHLLASRSASSTGLMTWRTVQGQPLAGFSHGAAGIALALSRLYELTSDERYRHAVQQAVEYENSLFSEEAQNWPNLLAPAGNGSFAFWNSWCHGAPGIGLARLGSRSCLDPDAYNRDLAVALEKAGDQQLTNVDGLCCGNLGRIELLIEASSHLGRPELLSHARQIGSSVLHRADSNGRFMVGIPNGIYVPSLHQGMAGVGYQFLRLAKPDQVPSVLSWN